MRLTSRKLDWKEQEKSLKREVDIFVGNRHHKTVWKYDAERFVLRWNADPLYPSTAYLRYEFDFDAYFNRKRMIRCLVSCIVSLVLIIAGIFFYAGFGEITIDEKVELGREGFRKVTVTQKTYFGRVYGEKHVEREYITHKAKPPKAALNPKSENDSVF